MLDAKEIAQVARLCIGHIEPIADTNYDEKSLENLDKQLEVISILLDDVQFLLHDSKSVAYSVRKIGCTAKDYLYNLRNSIDEWLKELDEMPEEY